MSHNARAPTLRISVRSPNYAPRHSLVKLVVQLIDGKSTQLSASFIVQHRLWPLTQIFRAPPEDLWGARGLGEARERERETHTHTDTAGAQRSYQKAPKGINQIAEQSTCILGQWIVVLLCFCLYNFVKLAR